MCVNLRKYRLQHTVGLHQQHLPNRIVMEEGEDIDLVNGTIHRAPVIMLIMLTQAVILKCLDCITQIPNQTKRFGYH